MTANLNREQSAALVSLLTTHGGPVTIEGGPGGVRFVTLLIDGEPVRYELAIDGEIQGGIPDPYPGLHRVSLLLDEQENPQTVHELGRLLLTWTDGPVPRP